MEKVTLNAQRVPVTIDWITCTSCNGTGVCPERLSNHFKLSKAPIPDDSHSRMVIDLWRPPAEEPSEDAAIVSGSCLIYTNGMRDNLGVPALSTWIIVNNTEQSDRLIVLNTLGRGNCALCARELINSRRNHSLRSLNSFVWLIGPPVLKYTCRQPFSLPQTIYRCERRASL